MTKRKSGKTIEMNRNTERHSVESKFRITEMLSLHCFVIKHIIHTHNTLWNQHYAYLNYDPDTLPYIFSVGLNNIY